MKSLTEFEASFINLNADASESAFKRGWKEFFELLKNARDGADFLCEVSDASIPLDGDGDDFDWGSWIGYRMGQLNASCFFFDMFGRQWFFVISSEKELLRTLVSSWFLEA